MAEAAGSPDRSWASSLAVRRVMQGNRGRDTRPEIEIRHELFRRGLRYRVGTRPLPGLRRTADIVFRRARVAVFVDGCFWHGCPAHRTAPRTNGAYWRPKLATVAQRDLDTTAALEGAGWTVIRVWEHEPVRDAVDRVCAAVSAARRSGAIG